MKENKPRLLRYLGSNLKEYKGRMIFGAVFAALEVVFEIMIPLLMSVIVDGGLYREPDFAFRSLFSDALVADRNRFVLTVGGIMVVITLLSLFCGIMSSRLSAVASQGFAKNLRTSLLAKIQSFSFANADRFTTPSLITRATTDVNTVRNTLHQFVRTLCREPITMILSTAMAMVVAPHLSVYFLISLPVLALILIVLLRIGQPRFKRMLRETDNMNRAVRENLLGNRVVKAYVRGEYETLRFETTTEALRNAQLRSARLFELTGPTQMIIMWGVSVLILLLGGREIIFEKTGLMTGQLVSIISYTTMALSSISMMSWLVMSFARAQASLERINEVLDEEPDVKDGTVTEGPEDGSLVFDNVCFSYRGPEGKLAIDHVSFAVRSGETLGIIGGTGEGKSTLVNLIPRFYDVTAGSVKVGGRDVRDYTLEALRSGVSMVLQNGTLFSGTVASNLKLGAPMATAEDLKEACDIACASGFIEELPLGLEAPVEQGGANFSGGQKQRLCIARAIVKKPKLLILDDSTSAVDMTTDEHIRRALKMALPHTTKIIIAQRIASVISCNKILVLEEGRLADFGTHAELMERSKIYRDVYDSQIRGEGEKGELNGKG